MSTISGKLIVIDGTDGSGKGTQTEILIKRLQDNGYDVATTDFPQYGKKACGPVEEYLNGKYGSAQEVGPYRASILYAVDRYDASFVMKQWLSEGKIIVSNRYVAANMGHQGAKITKSEERKQYLDWLYHLEYTIFNIPKPDLNLILHVPSDIAYDLIAKKDDREYLNGKKRDIHEADISHLRQAEQVYLEIAEQFSDFTKIKCAEDGNIMTRDEISDLIWEQVLKTIESQPKLEI